MEIKDIKEALQYQPHITQVWVKDGHYYTCPISGGLVVNLTDSSDSVEFPMEETKPLKTRKNKK